MAIIANWASVTSILPSTTVPVMWAARCEEKKATRARSIQAHSRVGCEIMPMLAAQERPTKTLDTLSHASEPRWEAWNLSERSEAR